MGWRGILTILFAVASIASGKFLYHLPWACAVLHESGSLVGACAILNAGNVLASVDNFNQSVLSYLNKKRYFDVTDELAVWAGSNCMNPSKAEKKPPFAQYRKVDNLFIGRHHAHSTTDKAERWEYIDKRNMHKDYDRLPQDLYGVLFNVGILKLHDNFLWTAYVRPINIKHISNIEYETKRYLSELSRDNSRIGNHLCVTYSWNKKKNKIRYHQVSYLPNEYCLDAFCGWNFSTCDRFPKKDHLVCYKSTNFADVCPNARGAALYCPTLYDSVLGILTSAPSCGLRHMPGVYTTLPLAIRLYESVYNTSYASEEEILPFDDPFKLNQRDEDYEGVL